MDSTTINHLPYLGVGVTLGGMAIAWLWHISVVAIRNGAIERELQSKERIRAIECGYPQDQTQPVNAAIAIGVGVPSCACGAAFMATLVTGGTAPFVWPAAAMVGVAGAICGTMLALKSMEISGQATHIPQKPVADPASFEMAGHHD